MQYAFRHVLVQPQNQLRDLFGIWRFSVAAELAVNPEDNTGGIDIFKQPGLELAQSGAELDIARQAGNESLADGFLAQARSKRFGLQLRLQLKGRHLRE